MPAITIVYHSGHGHTQHQAQAVLDGAASVDGVTTSLITSDDAINNMAPLTDADAIIFGCPTYMGSASAPFKAFMDATSPLWAKQLWKDKIAAGFTNSGGLSGDKLSTLYQLVTFAAQHQMIWVSQGIFGNEPSSVDGVSLNRIGSHLGAMAQSPQGQHKPEQPDLDTAHAFGARVAQATVRWNGRGE